MWGIIDDAVAVGGALVDAGGDVLNAVEEGAEDLANLATDAAQEIYYGINEITDAFDDAIDWLGDTLHDAEKDFVNWLDKNAEAVMAAINSIKTGIEAFTREIDDALQKITTLVSNVKDFFFEAVAAAANWVHDILPDPVKWILDDAIPFLWAGIKLIAALALIIAMWPVALATILICQQIAITYGKEQGVVFDHILNGNKRYAQMLKINRLPSDGKYFISSDQHWFTAGRMDTAGFQETKPLYLAVLQHYLANGFYLIENGDVEDYWLRGGSLYGDIFDVASQLPAPDLDRAYNEAQILAAAKYHLHTIVTENKELYTLIRAGFHDHNKYSRTVGNHDDVYSNAKMVDALRYFYPGINVYDYIVLEHQGKGVGLIGHGHQTDAWDMPGCSFLGKVITSLGSAVRDISFGEWKPGVADSEKTKKLWNFDADGSLNVLDELNPWLGVTAQLGNLDEVRLFRALKKAWKMGSDLFGPFVILGHTHVPLAAPIAPHNEGQWRHYANSGCGIFNRMITGIVWDGVGRPNNPLIQLVGWRYKVDVGEGASGATSKVLHTMNG